MWQSMIGLALWAAALLLPVGTARAQGLSARFAADPAVAQAALDLARDAFDAWVLRHERITPSEGLPALLHERSGVFVSAILGDAPRCCMGSLRATRPTLAEEIAAAARAAAGMDVRFPPVRPEELAELQVVLSIVEPPEPIAGPEGLDPAVDGLAVRGPERWGVVLPRETPQRELMEPWARIRAGVGPDEPIDCYRVRAFRIVEPVAKREGLE